jgi:hypothetical protein
MFKKAIALTFIIMFFQGCAYWVRGVWNTVMKTPAGETSDFSDATETITDEKGEFEIKGKGLRILSNLEPMNVLIFKTGYKYIGLGPWISFKKSSYYREKIKWEEDRAIIPLRKLTMAERRNNIPLLPPSEASLEKIILMLKEMNKNTNELGYQPIDKWRGAKL